MENYTDNDNACDDNDNENDMESHDKSIYKFTTTKNIPKIWL